MLAGEQHVGNLLYAAYLLWLQINGLVSCLVSLASHKHYVLRPEVWGGGDTKNVHGYVSLVD